MESNSTKSYRSHSGIISSGSKIPRMSVSAEGLEQTSRLIDAVQQNDQICADLCEKLRISPRIDVPSFSGLGDPHYVDLDSLGLHGVREFNPGIRRPLPQELQDQFLHMQCNCSMGLFSDISRAWVSVDSDLFIWNYESGTDLAYFDGLPNTILSVGLSRPKPGIFQPHIQYLLCIATAVDVVLLAVNFSDSEGNPVSSINELRESEMHLLPDPLFKVPLDGTVVSDVVACDNGRIFLSGKDGCLFELDYGERGWFKRQCKKINHSKGMMSYLVPSFVSFAFGADEPLSQIAIDETRHILFTLAETGSIQVFDLGAKGDQTSKVASISASSIENYAAAIVQTIEPSNFRPCVHIQAIESTESAVLNLVGVTGSGVRLYFTCYYPTNSPYAGYGKTEESVRPVTLRLIHVRLPPGFTASAMMARPHMVHFSWAEKDSFAFVSVANEDTDTLWGLSGANFPFQSDMLESVSQLPVRGRVWSIQSVKTRNEYLQDLWRKQWPACVLPVKAPSVVNQHVKPAQRIVLLTAQGIFEVEKQRPVDVLRRLIEEFGGDSQEVKAFFQLHQADQACAMCALLACSSSAQDRQNIAEKAVRAFFVFGGDPEMIFPTDQNVQQMSPNYSMADWSQLPGSPVQASTPTSPFRPVQSPRGVMTPPSAVHGGYNQSRITLTSGINAPRPEVTQMQQNVGTPHPEIRYSARHNGLYLAFGRILGSLWSMKMVVTVPQQKGAPMLDSALTSEELTWFLDQLKRLKSFFDEQSIIPSAIIGVGQQNPDTNSGYNVSPGRSNINQRILGFMRTEPVDSVSHARQQLSKKYKVEAVNGERQSLIGLSELVRRCVEILELWKVLADHQFGVLVAQLPSDILDVLRGVTLRQLVVRGKELCSDLITCLIRYHLSDDATTDEISDRLRRVCPGLYTNDDAAAAKASELLQSGRVMEEGPRKEETLEEALKLYRKVIHQIHLPTVCAQLQEALCYEGIVELSLRAADAADPQNLGLAYYKNGNSEEEDSLLRDAYIARMSSYQRITEQLDKFQFGSQDPRITAQMAQVNSEEMIKSVLESSDELAHVALYDWMLEKKRTEKLLHVSSPYLESYLQRRAADGGPSTERLMDLLWQFYEKQGRYMPAAKLLLNLAEQQSTQLDLSKRLTYLSRAVMCAKASSDSKADRGAFLQELEDKLEVARLQVQVLDCLKQLKVRPGHIREAIARLNCTLMDVTQLYTNYAEEFGLPESKLAIVHCAGHSDPELMETLWREIIEKELAMSQQDSSDVRLKRLETKLVQLSKLYSLTPRYYPAEFLVRTLQTKLFENGFEPEWLGRFAERSGISFSLILTTLNELYGQRQSVWRTNPRAQTHLLYGILSLIDRFCEETQVFPTDARRKFLSEAKDAVSKYQVELEGNPRAELNALRQSFHALEVKLMRVN